MSWSDLSDWWTSDAAYESVVTPLFFQVFSPVLGDLYLNLGAGEGRVMRSMSDQGMSVVGVDLSEDLAATSDSSIAVASTPPLPMRDDAFDGVYSVLTFKHILDLSLIFSECARVTKPRGVLVVFVNHPIWTAPGSSPITDTDGEVLWRPGITSRRVRRTSPPVQGTVTFHHRTMAALLNAASSVGWSLEQMIEQPHHELGSKRNPTSVGVPVEAPL